MKNDEIHEGIILIDKPKGITSFDVIRILRAKTSIQKIGHAGTLDPLASGLLVVAIGKFTKDISRYVKLPKTYEVEIIIGKRTTTGDLGGEILEEKSVTNLDKDILVNVLKSLVGKNIIPVPLFSAVKFKGRRLYKIGRSNVDVSGIELPKREMEIFSIILQNIQIEKETVVLSLSMDVASGVYVRSVTEEIGNRLRYPATVKELRRVSVGDFTVKDALKLELPHYKALKSHI